MTWRPVVTDPTTRASIVATLREIRDAVASTPAQSFGEHMDRALLFAYLAQDETIPDDGDAIGIALSRGVSLFVSSGAPPTLYNGAAGVGWIVEHLAGGEISESVCRAVDAALLRVLSVDEWRADYDLVSGLVGFGVYALGRGEAGTKLAERVLDHLAALARPRGSGVAWHTSPDLLAPWQREVAPDGYWNLGLAHGVPGVIAVLARYVTAGVGGERARELLDGGVAYLLAAESPRVGRYPSWHPAEGEPSRRLAWCYGDFGISVALLSAAHARDRDDWRAEALALARDCAATTFDAAHVLDTGLCHGAAGAVHLFGRLHHATGDAVFADAARRWIDRMFAMRRPGESVAGFPNRTDDAWEPDATLLNGAVGVGLALHAMISEVEPSWDRLMLVDVEPRH